MLAMLDIIIVVKVMQVLMSVAMNISHSTNNPGILPHNVGHEDELIRKITITVYGAKSDVEETHFGNVDHPNRASCSSSDLAKFLCSTSSSMSAQAQMREEAKR